MSVSSMKFADNSKAMIPISIVVIVLVELKCICSTYQRKIGTNKL